MKQKLLILGTGRDQLPGIEKSKELGFYTIGLDFDEDSPGVSQVDEFHKVNIKNEQAVKDFVGCCEHELAGVIAFGVDIPEIIAKAAETAGCYSFLNYKKAQISKNKLKSKELLKKYGVNLPHYKKILKIDDLKAFINEKGYPIILKPLDNSASRGVLFLTESVDIQWAFDESMKHSVQKENHGVLLAESFLDGYQLSTESIVKDGRIFTVGLSDRNYSLMEKYSPFIVENGGDLPPDPGIFRTCENMISAVDEELLKVVQAYDMENGVVKGDVVIHKDKVYIIEVALRLSGGHFSTFEIPMNTGVDFLKAAIQVYTGQEIRDSELTYRNIQHVRLRFFLEEPDKDYRIKSIRFEPLDNVKMDFYCKEGDFIGNFSRKLSLPVNKLGYYLISGDNKEDIVKLEKRVKETVVFEREYND